MKFCTLLWKKTATQKLFCIAVISKMHSKLKCDTRKIIPWVQHLKFVNCFRHITVWKNNPLSPSYALFHRMQIGRIQQARAQFFWKLRTDPVPLLGTFRLQWTSTIENTVEIMSARNNRATAHAPRSQRTSTRPLPKSRTPNRPVTRCPVRERRSQ